MERKRTGVGGFNDIVVEQAVVEIGPWNSDNLKGPSEHYTE